MVEFRGSLKYRASQKGNPIIRSRVGIDPSESYPNRVFPGLELE